MKTYILDLFAVALVLSTLPLVLELTVLTLASFLPKRRTSTNVCLSPLRMAVIIPAHNEQRLIVPCVESLRASAAGTDTRIIAIAHNCSDGTAISAARAGAEVITYNDPAAQGKGFALAHGFTFACAQGMDAVLVVDADSVVSDNLIRVVRGALANGCEAVQCRYEMDSSPERPKSRLTALALRGFNVVRPSGRDRLGLSAGILGNGFAIRQSVMANMPYCALSVVEDLEYHIKLVLSGRRVHFLPQAKVSSGLPSSKEGEATQRSRWEGGRANAARTWLLPLLTQLPIRGPRLLEPLLDLASIPIGYAALLFLVAACLPLAWLHYYVGFALIALTMHVVAATCTGSDLGGDLRILVRVPAYLLWKVYMLPRLLRSARTDAVWIRTEREPALRKAS